MVASTHSAFPHRTNSDGRFDSICPKCFRTVATKYDEADLASAEAAHIPLCGGYDSTAFYRHFENIRLPDRHINDGAEGQHPGTGTSL